MNKGYLVAGLCVGAAGFLYLKNRKSAAVSKPVNSVSKNVASNNQSYPFKTAANPRVDNQNQPWYTQALSAVGFGPKNDSTKMQSGSQDLGAGASIVHSLSNIWGDLGLSSTEPTADNNTLTVGDSDDLPGNYVDLADSSPAAANVGDESTWDTYDAFDDSNIYSYGDSSYTEVS